MGTHHNWEIKFEEERIDSLECVTFVISILSLQLRILRTGETRYDRFFFTYVSTLENARFVPFRYIPEKGYVNNRQNGNQAEQVDTNSVDNFVRFVNSSNRIICKKYDAKTRLIIHYAVQYLFHLFVLFYRKSNERSVRTSPQWFTLISPQINWVIARCTAIFIGELFYKMFACYF